MSLKTTLDHVKKNWKTTVSGILTSIIGLSAVASTPNPWISSSLGIKILSAATISKIVLGVMQTDGSNMNVKLPDNSNLQMNIPAGSTVNQTTNIETKE